MPIKGGLIKVVAKMGTGKRKTGKSNGSIDGSTSCWFESFKHF